MTRSSGCSGAAQGGSGASDRGSRVRSLTYSSTDRSTRPPWYSSSSIWLASSGIATTRGTGTKSTVVVAWGDRAPGLGPGSPDRSRARMSSTASVPLPYRRRPLHGSKRTHRTRINIAVSVRARLPRGSLSPAPSKRWLGDSGESNWCGEGKSSPASPSKRRSPPGTGHLRVIASPSAVAPLPPQPGFLRRS